MLEPGKERHHQTQGSGSEILESKIPPILEVEMTS